MTSQEVLNALRRSYFQPGRWSWFEEVQLPQISHRNRGQQRVDAWAISSSGNCIASIEVKVDKRDFANEIRNPRKRRHAMAYSNQFFFAAPKGLLKREEIPLDCGLLEVDDEGRVWETIEAPKHEAARPSWEWFAAIAREISQQRDYYALVKIAEEVYETVWQAMIQHDGKGLSRGECDRLEKLLRPVTWNQPLTNDGKEVAHE